MYNHSNQYRCIIIRGKSQRELDNLLPAYAMVIDEICPCVKEEFENRFNQEFVKVLHGKKSNSVVLKKTLDNHRTEIAGKLFGMYYLSADGVFYASERTKKFLSDNDQPAFFKDVCYKMQFPNGMNKIQTLQPHLDLKISLRPYPFIIKCLMIAEEINMKLSINDIGYYILNSLDVLQGKSTPQEVLEQIKIDKECGIKRKIVVADKATSYTMQHIREQINYLELSNLIYINDDKKVVLNKKESACINVFAQCCLAKPAFDMYAFDTTSIEGREQLYQSWDFYYSKISDEASIFDTKVEALIIEEEKQTVKAHSNSDSKVELGDEGEQFVYEYERKRVENFNPRLVNKVLPLGRTKGLGYDIQSVIAENGENAEFVKYIEVKSTKRVTAPNITDDTWMDTINITRNEWVAAQQHKEFYSIYRVYFVRDGVVVFTLKNIYEKEKKGIIQIVPTIYRVDFTNNAVDTVLE
ncbi:MAG: DUF3883 domain-containing protein [Clostridia bacterium]|nr:DUF3883 domain-containing protein [Clostridia bacterium]